MIDPVIASLGGATIGAAIGGCAAFFTARTSATRQRDLEVERRTIAKLEEAYTIASTLAHQGGMMFAAIVGHLNHGRAFNRDDLGGVVDNPRLMMLVAFYAPTLKPLAAEMEAQWVRMGLMAGEAFGVAPKSSTIMADASTLNKEISKCGDSIKAGLTELAVAYGIKVM